METIKRTVKIDKGGRLKTDMPTSLGEGESEIVVLVEKKENVKKRYDFTHLAGKLHWPGDPLEAQHTLRHEW